MVRKVDPIKDIEENEEFSMSSRAGEIPFTQLMDALLDGSTPLPPRYLYRLSDINDEDYDLLQKDWNKIPLWRRQALMDDLQILAENDLMLSFETVSRLALKDEDPKVRFGAIETLMSNECESTDLVDIFLEVMEKDKDNEVRSIAASALGRFVYLGEMEEIHGSIKRMLEDRLLQVCQTENNGNIRRCALESLGFSSRDEIPPIIETFYNSVDADFQTSALTAMGRSGNERWRPQILSVLTHSNPSIRTDAARAAGELNIAEARPHLIDLVEDANQSVSMAALWSLSQIGGKGVRKILQTRLQEADDNEEIDFLESAIDNLDFNEGAHDIDILDVEEAESEDLYSTSELDDDIDADELFDFDDDEDDDDIYGIDDEDGFDDLLGDEDDEEYEDYYDDDEDDGDLWH